jgi:hypothetical protein
MDNFQLDLNKADGKGRRGKHGVFASILVPPQGEGGSSLNDTSAGVDSLRKTAGAMLRRIQRTQTSDNAGSSPPGSKLTLGNLAVSRRQSKRIGGIH